MTEMKDEMATSIERLLDIMARLRDPSAGCPWDIEQNYRSIVPHTIEEAYEVADAIERGDLVGLRDELGDLLFQVVFYAQMAREDGSFDFEAVVRGICEKMVARHPHVFGDAEIATAEAQTLAWESGKAEERKARSGNLPLSALDGVALPLPAATRAIKLQKRAARVGFDWPDPQQVIAKIEEEIAEVRAEIVEDPDQDRLEDEIGDVLFACVNLARKLNIDPEQALRRCNAKFERRFRSVELGLAERGKSADQATLEEMEELWVAAKHAEHSP
jgi:ATP diphosphatase